MDRISALPLKRLKNNSLHSYYAAQCFSFSFGNTLLGHRAFTLSIISCVTCFSITQILFSRLPLESYAKFWTFGCAVGLLEKKKTG